MSKLPWVTFDNLTSVNKANSGFLNSTLPEHDFKREINILKNIFEPDYFNCTIKTFDFNYLTIPVSAL